MTTLFVYGSLKFGEMNHDRIFGGFDIKVTPAWTYGKLYDLGCFPALTEGNNKVYGELIEFDNLEILKKVDYLEGFKGVNHSHNYYERRMVDVFVGDDTVKAWVYFLSDEQIKQYDGKIIVSGKWIDWRQVEFPAD
ncbi:MAG: gamma-glutamylcyclotransferase [Candidatus Marinimicrobia bacterium]|nr:gamma-glutamylcyclotransferase [Candidatus Neomarinimicrobiota bacterium]